MPVVDYESALEFLLGRVNYETFRQMPYGEMRQNLGRLRAFLDFLGRPDSRFPVVHVAGTKGKGSTCAMLAAVFRESGRRVGCFTSPHLHSLNERFAINGVPCPNDRLVKIVQSLESQWHDWPGRHVAADHANEQRELTFFEYSVLVAFEYFSRERVDLAVIETGLGGRFDATNICEPVLSVITSISFEHTEQLGDTLSAIAGEKAGIIKPGVPVVSGVLPHEGDDPLAVVREVAARNHSELYEINRDFSIVTHDDGSFDFRWHPGNAALRPIDDGTRVFERLQLRLLGRHQRENAALVLASVILLRQQGQNVSDEAVRAALAGIEVPARVERISLPGDSGPCVIVDGAHNRASAEALLESLQALVETRRDKSPVGRKILLFGSTLGKDIPGMFETLLPFFDELWLSQCSASPRAVPVGNLIEIANASPCKPRKILAFASIDEATERMRRSTGENDLACVTGSLYFAAEARQLLLSCEPAANR